MKETDSNIPFWLNMTLTNTKKCLVTDKCHSSSRKDCESSHQWSKCCHQLASILSTYFYNYLKLETKPTNKQNIIEPYSKRQYAAGDACGLKARSETSLASSKKLHTPRTPSIVQNIVYSWYPSIFLNIPIP